MNLIVLALTTLFVNASNDYILSARGSDKKEPYFKINNIRISDIQLCKEKTCRAFLIASGKVKYSKKLKSDSGGTNPTSFLCKDLLGVADIAVSNKGNDISVCRFDDGSFLLSWDLVK